MQFTTSHSITNLIKEKNLKCNKILEAGDVIRESLKRKKKIAYLRVFAYPHVLSSSAPRNSMADNLAVSEDLGFLY